ncbi:hypothetical protein TNIN_69101 [Trichonephila inaurata madagascariensis]|uniref:Uncharacterized protein n=1 Tax=Trichonephila inaurata madagascariensis TaxID=2747483 RepID=A0A8X6K1C6_9ARAC|nr:hypothetical protein TNIN_69101 [Trichonephila inaurata madagascariensis]
MICSQNCPRMWFKGHEDDIQLIQWVPNYPDLCHCEHLWEYLDLLKRQQDPQPLNLPELCDALLVSLSNISVASVYSVA